MTFGWNRGLGWGWGFRKGFNFENLLIYLWCDLALLVGSRQELWNKFHSLVPLKIWNCTEPIIFGKMQSLGMKAGTLDENAKLTPCVLQWLKEDEARSNTARFGDLTHAIQISQVRRRIRTASPGQEGPSLDESVQGLDLNAAVGLTSYSRDELWKAHGPQTLQEACSTENMTTQKKAVQQPSKEGSHRV